MITHSWAICAYGDSPYLEACLRSVSGQTLRTKAVICTSTPSPYIYELAEKYGMPVLVREGEPGIGRDWNFAYEQAETDLVTLAHQDDIYSSRYAETAVRAKERYPDMSLFTCDAAVYKEPASDGTWTERLVSKGKAAVRRHLPGGDTKISFMTPVGTVKKLLRIPLRVTAWNDMTELKRAAVSLGNPIVCPSCTYDKPMCGPKLWDEELRFTVDWDALVKLSGKRGRWICDERPLMVNRIHKGAETSRLTGNGVREKEESDMFDRLLPPGIADTVKKFYRLSYGNYRL